MGRLVLKNDDGTEILIRSDVNESLLPFDVILRSEYIAMKLWSREDITSMLCEHGYEPSEENVDKVLDVRCIEYLNDCIDYDWELIDQAISEADRNFGLEKRGEDKDDDADED